MEITIIVLVTVIICNQEETCGELNRHFGAIVIVLSWAELIVLLGRHPKLTEYNIYVTMFLKVLKTFLFFITWYSLFIIAFGLGFYILLHKAEEEVGDEDYVYFNKAWLAIVKTTTMFVGELEVRILYICSVTKLTLLLSSVTFQLTSTVALLRWPTCTSWPSCS